MSAELSAAEVEALLAEHAYVPCAEFSSTVKAWWAQCEGCDWKGPRRSYRGSEEGDHRAHVAALVAQAASEREQAAKAEGHAEGIEYAADITETFTDIALAVPALRFIANHAALSPEAGS